MTALWRADAAASPWLGYASFWAADREAAAWYLRAPGFGGPALYRADVQADDRDVLDLRGDPWAGLGEHFWMDRADYEHEQLHEVIWALALRLRGHPRPRWIVFDEGDGEQWVYLGDEPLAAVRE
jgi:hypothetical protein